MKERAFQKRLFCSKSAAVTAAADFGKTVVLTLSLKEGCQKNSIFFYSDLLHPVVYHAKKINMKISDPKGTVANYCTNCK
jgi:hypothetical protein